MNNSIILDQFAFYPSKPELLRILDDRHNELVRAFTQAA